MIVTRKIEVYVCCDDKEQQKQMRRTVYEWRDWVRRAANTIVAHKFVQQNVRDFLYLQDDVLERFMQEHPDKVKTNKNGDETVAFHVSDILKQGRGMSEQNTTYRIVSKMLKGKVPSDVFSCLNQAVCKMFKETVGEYLKGNASIRSYKNNIPIPFSAKALSNIHETDGRYYFTLFGIPFACRLGADRSNNAVIIDRCIDGDYSLCGSSLMIDDRKCKMFLLLCFDQPEKEVSLTEGKTLFARLDVDTPIIASTDVKAKQSFDSGVKSFPIGNKEEFLHRRIQIQEAVKRCQINNRYSTGGHGRKQKCKAIEHWYEKERNYVETKTHTYSRMLVDMAVKNKCASILLVGQKEREDKAKEENRNGEPFLLRNWSYYGLKDKITYKANQYGINVIVE